MGKKDNRRRQNAQARQQRDNYEGTTRGTGKTGEAGDPQSQSTTPSAPSSETSSMADTGDSNMSKRQGQDPDPFVIEDEQPQEHSKSKAPREREDTARGSAPSKTSASGSSGQAAKTEGSSQSSHEGDKAGEASTQEWAQAGDAPRGGHHRESSSATQSGRDKPQTSGTNSSAGGVGTDAIAGSARAESRASQAQMSERGSQTNPMQHSAFVDPSTAHDLGPDPIRIVDAQKTSDGVGQSPYIAYLIECDSLSAKRRYSEFASLRDALVTLHPTLIIPPIPSKHSLSDYYARQAKAKEDASIVARRKRMLQVFLNRIKDHEKLNRSLVFRRFLDGRWSWHEITSSPPLSTLPKSNLRAPAADPSSPHASPAYLALPLPPSSAGIPLKNPNNRFLDSEAFTERFRNHLQGSLEKINRRTAKRWTEASSDYAELGAVLNEFSLSENGALANAIERTGQAADQTFMAIGKMLAEWETKFTEPLSEYGQFASVLQKLLRWRHMKHLQYEMAQDALEAKRVQLEELERIEAEANRLNAALASGGRGLVPSNPRASSSAGQGRDGVWDSVNNRGSTMKRSVYGSAAENDVPSPPGNASKLNAPTLTQQAGPRTQADRLADSEEWTEPSLTDSSGSSRATSPKTAANGGDGLTPEQRAATGRYNTVGGRPGAGRGNGARSGGAGGGGLLGALSNTLHSVMDVDPEATRRNTISRLKDSCAQLEEALELTERDLRYATQAIQADLDRFQRQKIRDMRDMIVNFARIHRDYCAAGLESWSDAKTEIDAITDRTPLPESSLVRAQRRAGGDSTGGAAMSSAGGSSGATPRRSS